MRRCDREEIDPPWPRLAEDCFCDERDEGFHLYAPDPLVRRAWGVATRRSIGFTARPWPIVAERVAAHLRDYVTLP